MVVKYYFVFVTLLCSFKLSICQRRIVSGRSFPDGKSYMVYLLPSVYTKDPPDSWLCGGVIVTETRVLTAAACLLDVDHTYVIAGYQKYVRADDVNNDDCTRMKKQKIVKIVVPKAYNLSNWTILDIGVAVVEKPYNFLDASYKIICSYPPSRIRLNFAKKYETEGKNANTYGWGGQKARKPGQTMDINSKYLKEARTIIIERSECQKKTDANIEIAILCAYGTGRLLADGRDANMDQIYYRRNDVKDQNNTKCSEENGSLKCDKFGPALNGIFNQYTNSIDKTEDFGNKTNTRRLNVAQNAGAGACQNDHGGALVQWIGKNEYLLGISITSILNSNYDCNGPYLYTSIAQNSFLIQCLLAMHESENEKKCKIVEQLVEWPDTRKNILRQELTTSRPQPLTTSDQIMENEPPYSVRLRPQVQLGNDYANVYSYD